MATFGNTNIEATDSGTQSTNLMVAGLFSVASGDGIVDSISIRTRTVSGTGNVKGVLVGQDKTLISNGVTNAQSITSTDTWVTASYTSKPLIRNGNLYYIGFIPDATFGCISKLAASGGTSLTDTTNNYTTPTNPFDGTDGTTLFSYYATYSVLPTINTNAVTTYTTTTAELQSNISSEGDADVTRRGFVYSTTSQIRPANVAPTSSGYSSYVEETGSFTTGSFSLSVTDLSPGVKYFVRAFAESTVGYNYSLEEVSFSTPALIAFLTA